MKKFNITVNGKSYEVEVEELGGTTAAAPRAAAPAPVAAPAPAKAAAPAAAPAPAKAAGPVAGGKEVISAPMPGKITAIKVKVGQAVKAGDLICTLEAMKMENEMFCSVAGTVKDIRVSEGATVAAGEAVVVID